MTEHGSIQDRKPVRIIGQQDAVQVTPSFASAAAALGPASGNDHPPSTSSNPNDTTG